MTAPLVSFSGLASGFDYRSLVDAIVAQERQPAVRLESRLSALTNQQAAMATFRTRLAALEAAAADLRDGTAFDATTSSTTVLSGTRALATVRTTTDVQSGDHTLTVTQLARAEKLVATGVSSVADAMGGAGGVISINGVEITVAATDTLADLRDRINALNTGSTPLGVSASILSVNSTDHRLVLTSAKPGAAGVTLADVSGAVLQGLGLLDAMGDVPPTAVLTEGTDAQFSIDGISMTRTSNVVDDVLEGVTLTLVAAEVGAETAITTGRFADAARSTMQTFVDAYNGLLEFVKAQGSVSGNNRPALYNDSLLRGIRRDLPSMLLGTVLGASTDLATAASAGLSLSRDGVLSLDATTFDTAFNTRYDDLRAVFTEQRTSTSSDVSFVSSASAMGGGTWAVEITAPATHAVVSTAGFTGSYDAGATPDAVTITDTRSGRSIAVNLTTGMSTTDIVAAIQAGIDTEGLGIEVSALGDEIVLTHESAGLASGISLAFTGLGDGASEAWSADVGATGTDVAGTIGGHAATGSGSVLVGDAGTAVEGLTIRYSGLTSGPAGDVTLVVGTGAAIERILDRFIETGGLLDTRDASAVEEIERSNNRIADIDARLERRRALLTARFVQMEAAIARLQQSSGSFLSALNPNNGGA